MMHASELTEEDLAEIMFDGGLGVCTKCGVVEDWDLEPDAPAQECHPCGKVAVVSAEQAIICHPDIFGGLS